MSSCNRSMLGTVERAEWVSKWTLYKVITNSEPNLYVFMFIEPHIKGEKRGWIEVICGSMFSGKTEEIIRRLKRVKIANLKVEIMKRPSYRMMKTLFLPHRSTTRKPSFYW